MVETTCTASSPTETVKVLGDDEDNDDYDDDDGIDDVDDDDDNDDADDSNDDADVDNEDNNNDDDGVCKYSDECLVLLKVEIALKFCDFVFKGAQENVLILYFQVHFEVFKDAFVNVLSNTIDSMAEATEEDKSEISDILDTGIDFF